jgi:stringent starvation protein B
MSPPHPLPPKKDVALALLERSNVFVHLDPRQEAVVVPEAFKKQAQLVLQVGLDMAVRIPDLRVDDQGMSCTLSFSREPFFCVVPWASVFALVGNNGQGMVWPDDMPAEVQKDSRTVENAVPRESQGMLLVHEPKAEGPKPKRPRKRPVLAAVADAGPQDAGAKPVKAVRAAADRPSRPGQAIAPRPAPAPASSSSSPSRSNNGARKKRKELPPYLRVVK